MNTRLDALAVTFAGVLLLAFGGVLTHWQRYVHVPEGITLPAQAGTTTSVKVEGMKVVFEGRVGGYRATHTLEVAAPWGTELYDVVLEEGGRARATFMRDWTFPVTAAGAIVVGVGMLVFAAVIWRDVAVSSAIRE